MGITLSPTTARNLKRLLGRRDDINTEEGLLRLSPGDVDYLLMLASDGLVGAVLNTTPITILVTGHGLQTGDTVYIDGVFDTEMNDIGANGEWIITVIDEDSFSLNDSSGTGDWEGTQGTWSNDGNLRARVVKWNTTASAWVQYGRVIVVEANGQEGQLEAGKIYVGLRAGDTESGEALYVVLLNCCQEEEPPPPDPGPCPCGPVISASATGQECGLEWIFSDITNYPCDNQPTAWSWNFGDGTGSGKTVIHTFATTGNKTVELTIFNGATECDDTTANIEVISTPTAMFAPAVTCLGALAGEPTFFANASTCAVSYEWDFGDSGTSTDETPSHTFDDPGVYTVTLTATSSSGHTDEHTEMVIVYQRPLTLCAEIIKSIADCSSPSCLDGMQIELTWNPSNNCWEGQEDVPCELDDWSTFVKVEVYPCSDPLYCDYGGPSGGFVIKQYDLFGLMGQNYITYELGGSCSVHPIDLVFIYTPNAEPSCNSNSVYLDWHVTEGACTTTIIDGGTWT